VYFHIVGLSDYSVFAMLIDFCFTQFSNCYIQYVAYRRFLLTSSVFYPSICVLTTVFYAYKLHFIQLLNLSNIAYRPRPKSAMCR